MMLKTMILGLVVGSALTACGAIADPENRGEPFWSFHGKIYDAREKPTGQIRAALLWAEDIHQPNGVGTTVVAQDVSVSSSLPADFTIDLFELPPESALHTPKEWDPNQPEMDLLVAIGYLLIYTDRNSNHKLDLLPKEALEPVDYALGPWEFYRFYYYEGDMSQMTGVDPGLNILQWTSRDQVKKLQLDEEIQVTLFDSSSIQYLMCQIFPEFVTVDPVSKQFAPADVPSWAEVTCSSDGHSLEFTYLDGYQEGGVCSQIIQFEVHASSTIPQGETPPENWPCKT